MVPALSGFAAPIPFRYRRVAAWCWMLLAYSSVAGLAADLEPSTAVSYLRDVQPILSEHCAQCHSVDASAREGGLRLDLREAALKGGESGLPAIVPGHPETSELIRRITSDDPDLQMPPRTHNKPLTAKQIATLNQWIVAGAPYETHWSFTTPRKVETPSAVHPIDALVEATLQQRGRQLAPPAFHARLCRRIYLDVIGLPPSPADVAAFERDGLTATLEALLQRPQFGQKWARHWLDLARYSDTNGYEKDLRREQWIWRDWVVDAFNQDMPYNQFLIEQIAGDLLPDASQSQVIATGFLRNSMINEEGAIVPEQFRMVEMFDRLDCIGKAVLGLTTQCAQCHSHKFDPLTQQEYYGMFASLNNCYEAQSWVYTAAQLQQIAAIREELAKILTELRQQPVDWDQQLAAWERATLAQSPAWESFPAKELGSVSGLNHPTQEADHSLLMLGHSSEDIFMIATPDLNGVTGLQLEILPHGDLPHGGPGRSRVGTWGVMELDVSVKRPGEAAWEPVKLVHATADFAEPEKKIDDKQKSGPVAFLTDGLAETTWRADRGVGRRNQASVAVVQFEKPLDYPAGTELKLALRMRDMVGCCRFRLTRQVAPSALPIPYAAILAMQVDPAARTVEQQQAIEMAWLGSQPQFAGAVAAMEKLWQGYPEAETSVLHLRERANHQTRATHILERGNWDQPQAVVEPHTPAALHPWPTQDEPARLRLARWLADPQSPLTARVAVNRVWQALFGEGLVETAEDFGTRAAIPEYRELLDWLAVDLMEHDWSHKHLIRTIITSRVYQQSSDADRSLWRDDPRNRWLARGPRFRADAEVVRDMALSISGLLVDRPGGPGIIPPVPQNVLDFNFVYPDYWKPTEGPERYRRSLYLFRKRSMPDPALSTLDAPNGDFACARRLRSNTPLAALTCLNEPIFVEAAQALALRILREAPTNDAQRADYAFQLCLGRLPTTQERDTVLKLLDSQRLRVADGWLNARDITTGNPSTLPPLPPQVTPQDAAVWTLAARVVLNLDETITKN